MNAETSYKPGNEFSESAVNSDRRGHMVWKCLAPAFAMLHIIYIRYFSDTTTLESERMITSRSEQCAAPTKQLCIATRKVWKFWNALRLIAMKVYYCAGAAELIFGTDINFMGKVDCLEK